MSQAIDDLLLWLRDYAGTRIDFRLQDERRTIQPHIALDLGRRGLVGGLRVPVQYGGLGLSRADALRFGEQLGAIDLTLAAWIGQNSWLGVQPIIDAGTEAHRQEFLPDLAQGRVLASFALTEPAAGSDPNALESTLTEAGPDRFVLRGRKSWIGNASWSAVTTVFAKQIAPDGQASGFTGCLLRTGTPGYEIGPELLTMGLRAAVQNRLTFRDVEVPRADILGEPTKGFTVMHDAMQGARIGIAAVAVGGMRRCVVLQHRYATRRKTSRGMLSDYPAVVIALNECLAKLHAIAAVVRQVTEIDAAAGREAIPDSVYIAAKVAGSEFLWEVADATVQLLGARGYTESNDAARFLRDARVFRIFEGPSEALEHFLGVLASGRPLQQFLTDTLGATNTARRLQTAITELRARKSWPAKVLPANLQHLVYAAAGKLVRWAIVLACLDREFRQRPTLATEAARDWTRAQFDALIASTVSGSWDHRAPLNIDDIGELLAQSELTAIARHDIGEVHASDPELRVEPE